MYRSLLFLSCALLAAPAAAQKCVYVPANTPTSGTCNVIPFGTTKSSSTWRNQKYQTIILSSQLGRVPGQICEIAFSPCGTSVMHADQITIKMNHTKISSFAGNLNYATNLGIGATTVLAAKNWAWHATANKWNRIGLARSFLYIPTRGNLIIEIELRNMGQVQRGSLGFHRSTTSEFPDRLYAFGWSTNPPANGRTDRAGLKIEVCFDTNDLALFGQSCGGAQHALSGSAKIGQAVGFDVFGAPTTPPIAVLTLGTAALPVPVAFPGTNCFIYTNFNLLALGLTTRNGRGGLRLVMPKAVCLRLYSQYFVIRSGRIESTNYGRVLVGN